MARITPTDAVDCWLAIEQAITTLKAFVYQAAVSAEDAAADIRRMAQVEECGISRADVDDELFGRDFNVEMDLEPGDTHYHKPRMLTWRT